MQVLSEIDSGRFWKTIKIILYFQNQKHLDVVCIIGLFFSPLSFFFLRKNACTWQSMTAFFLMVWGILLNQSISYSHDIISQWDETQVYTFNFCRDFGVYGKRKKVCCLEGTQSVLQQVLSLYVMRPELWNVPKLLHRRVTFYVNLYLKISKHSADRNNLGWKCVCGKNFYKLEE